MSEPVPFTGRSVEEWKGKTPDTPVPDRVRVRVFDREEGRCHCCRRLIRTGEHWTLEHRKAMINGGENRENNLCLTCDWCLSEKNAADVAEKSTVYGKRLKHILPKEHRGSFGRRFPDRTKRLEEL
jgi:5-methylcytosine-specific restriction endonuclease McrA